MRKTKIVCTMGPNTNDKEIMRGLVRAGMNVARFNFSHGDHEEQKGRMDLLREVCEEENANVALLLDTKGPEIRTGLLKDGKKVELKTGSAFVLTTEEIVGDETKVYVSHKDLPRDVRPGKKILIDDGLIELEVQSVAGNEINCLVLNSGILGEKKGINVPDTQIHLPAITEKDIADIRFGVEQGIDFIAASFVRNAEAILEIRSLLRELEAPYTPIIAKIENAEGIRNIDEILRAADGIMVARGDLGVEIPAQELPYLQKTLIQKSKEHFKTVITATQMLDSMTRNPRPTRAEVTDVANAVFDGTDAVMLSGETANGKYPIEAVNMMVQIVEDAEQHLNYSAIHNKEKQLVQCGASSAIGFAAVSVAETMNAKCIITPTVMGHSACVMSNLKPLQPILGVTPNERTLRRMAIYWGVIPIKSPIAHTSDSIHNNAIELAVAKNYAQKDDVVIVTAGILSPNVHMETRSADTNMMRIATIK